MKVLNLKNLMILKSDEEWLECMHWLSCKGRCHTLTNVAMQHIDRMPFIGMQGDIHEGEELIHSFGAEGTSSVGVFEKYQVCHGSSLWMCCHCAVFYVHLKCLAAFKNDSALNASNNDMVL